MSSQHLPAPTRDWAYGSPTCTAATVDGDPRMPHRRWASHQCVAVGEFPFESAKIGGGPPPIRVPEGWLLIHHGVEGEVDTSFDPSLANRAIYRAGALLLDPDDPSRVLARTAEPLLEPETASERVGTVANVVFPTAIADIGDRQFVFYGMADARIGVAELERTATGVLQ